MTNIYKEAAARTLLTLLSWVIGAVIVICLIYGAYWTFSNLMTDKRIWSLSIIFVCICIGVYIFQLVKIIESKKSKGTSTENMDSQNLKVGSND